MKIQFQNLLTTFQTNKLFVENQTSNQTAKISTFLHKNPPRRAFTQEQKRREGNIAKSIKYLKFWRK